MGWGLRSAGEPMGTPYRVLNTEWVLWSKLFKKMILTSGRLYVGMRRSRRQENGIIKKTIPKCWMDKQMWSIHALKYYSAIQRNEVLTHATVWMNLKNIILSERSPSQNTAYCMVTLTWNAPNRRIYPDEKVDSWLPGAEGREGWGVIGNGHMVSFWVWKMFRNYTVVMVCNSEVLLSLEACFIKYNDQNWLVGYKSRWLMPGLDSSPPCALRLCYISLSCFADETAAAGSVQVCVLLGSRAAGALLTGLWIATSCPVPVAVLRRKCLASSFQQQRSATRLWCGLQCVWASGYVHNSTEMPSLPESEHELWSDLPYHTHPQHP